MNQSDAKTIVVTGATRGLGRALALQLAAMGHRIAACGRDTVLLESLLASIGETNGLIQPLDVRDEDVVAAFAKITKERFGAPHFLINNAATINANAPLWEVSPREFADVVDINLKGVHLMIHHFLPMMIEAKRGVVVNFSSGWGRSTAPDVAPYCATKYGIEGLTAALAQELPPGLAAVSLNPGIIDTAMLRSCFGDSAGDFPNPESWARTAAPFLLKLGVRDNGAALTAP